MGCSEEEVPHRTQGSATGKVAWRLPVVGGCMWRASIGRHP